MGKKNILFSNVAMIVIITYKVRRQSFQENILQNNCAHYTYNRKHNTCQHNSNLWAQEEPVGCTKYPVYWVGEGEVGPLQYDGNVKGGMDLCNNILRLVKVRDTHCGPVPKWHFTT